jgi:hypothetical protein
VRDDWPAEDRASIRQLIADWRGHAKTPSDAIFKGKRTTAPISGRRWIVLHSFLSGGAVHGIVAQRGEGANLIA